MGKLKIPANLQMSWDMMEPDVKERVLAWTGSLPVDTLLYSAWRDAGKQAALRKVYDDKVAVVTARYKAGQLTKAQYDKEIQKLRGQIANRPFYSAHNWGLAVDVHPVTYASKDYQIMKDTAGKFGLIRDSVEKWHFQDNRFKRDLVPQWLTSAPDWLSKKTTALVKKTAKVLLTNKEMVAGVLVTTSLISLYFF